ncbi:MAG: hypothetical protein KatS3mg019_0719 [Fimbriimonadales bacterium]|nr:MAG: hypothetical protein KatS3mg019_0719 [Fimbriimonadales bacterium]
MSVLAAFAQAPNCTLITVPDTDEWRDWKVESIAGVTDEGVAAGTLVYTGNDTNVRVRKRIFRWNRADERITIFDPPVNDNEANLVTGVEALDFSVDGTAIAGRITYQGRPSAAFVFRGGLGYRILKQRRALGQTTTGLALSGRAVGYKGYHLAVQPSNDSAFVVPDPFGGSSSLNLRCGMSLPERIPVRVQRCTWSPLQGQNEIAEPDPTDDIDDTLEFMWIDEQGTVSAFILRGRDLFGPGWIPPWSGGGDQNVRGNERFHVMDISPDGSMVVGSMEVLRGGCYITSSGYVFQLDRGEYVMKAERLVVGFPDYGGYAYLAEFKPFFEEQPIRGRATCMAGYYWGNYDWTDDDMCNANNCRVVAGVLHPYGGRSGRAFTWYSWGTGDNNADYWHFFANGHHSEVDPVQVSKVSGVSADESLLLLGHRRYQPSTQGYTGYWYYLDWHDLWNPLPAPSKCVDTFAMSPSGRFAAVKYEDGQCLSGAAVIDISLGLLNGDEEPDEVKVVYRNLDRPEELGASYPYVGERVELRLFLRYGSLWYTKDCSISEVLRSRWFENGSIPASGGAGEYYELSPSISEYEKIWYPRYIALLDNRRSRPLSITWYSGHHSVDIETELTLFCSTPCRANVGGRPKVVGWKRYFWYPWFRVEALNQYAFTLRAGHFDTFSNPDNDYEFDEILFCPELCVPGTVRIHARVDNSYNPGDPLRRVYFSSAPTPGGYRPPSQDDDSTDESRWSQNCDEPDELAVRISVRARTGNAFVDWASAFLNIPYEYGGQGFGARADNKFDSSVEARYSLNSCGATHRGLENYGIDCSGLVVSAYNLAGYYTPDMRASSFITSPLFDAVALRDIRLGDILASANHVMIVYKVHQIEGSTVRATVLDAAGAPAHRVRLLRCTLSGNPDADAVRILLDGDEHIQSTFYIRRRR